MALDQDLGSDREIERQLACFEVFARLYIQLVILREVSNLTHHQMAFMRLFTGLVYVSSIPKWRDFSHKKISIHFSNWIVAMQPIIIQNDIICASEKWV